MARANHEKVWQLYRLHKYSQAVKEASDLLANEPENASLHALKALAHVALKNMPDALQSAQKAISIGPEDDFNHYVLGTVHFRLTKEYSRAETSLKEALRLNPQGVNYYDALAQIKMMRSHNSVALQLCQKGLAIDPRHEGCLSTRALLLTKLGRKQEAGDDLKAALMTGPENPETIAALGWVKLETNDYRGALESFRNALRIIPDYEYARSGLLQALKAKSFLYRQYLRYAFWLDRLNPQVRWLLVFGAAALAQVLKRVPSLTPLLIVYGLFALSTWIINPVHNMILRFNKYGKLVLSRSETMGATLSAAAVVTALASIIAGVFMKQIALYVGAAALFLMIIPITSSATFFSEQRSKFRKSLIFSVSISIFILLGFAYISVIDEVPEAPLVLFGIALVLELFFTWFVALTR